MGNEEKMPPSYWDEVVILICLWFARPTHIIVAFDLPQPVEQVELSYYYLCVPGEELSTPWNTSPSRCLL